MAKPLIESRQHTLNVSVPVGALFVEGDAVRLAQVIANLLQNAAKYTDPGGVIEVDGRREGPDMVIRVKDNGRGIPPERLPAMFELFVQGDQVADRSQGGLGIGLTLVRSLVQLHGGSVDAHSEGPGRGSEFIIRLPASARESPRPTPVQAAAAPAKPYQRKRVLIVDDDIDAADMLAQALQGAGHEVRQEHDGTSALVAAAQFQPDVVLLDLGLPGMGGLEVARRLRGYPQLAGIRILALTGFGQGSDRNRSAAVGIESHLVKPVDVKTVMEAIASGRVAIVPEPSA
jgi:CheY-like chemotaxis protein/anti-sigma regulatory factor (Ser/Thr protein kinase)